MNPSRLHVDLVDMLRDMRIAERDVFAAINPQVRDAPLRDGDWSPKDHQAHLTAWKERQAQNVAALRDGAELPAAAAAEIDAINAEYRAAHADWSWGAIEAEADQVSEHLILEILATDPARIVASEPIVSSTFGNGAFHAITHFGWLLAADIGIDAQRVDAFVDDMVQLVSRGGLPDSDIGTTLYNVACFYALAGRMDSARAHLRDAFRLHPELLEWAREDSDVTALRDELEVLAGR